MLYEVCMKIYHINDGDSSTAMATVKNWVREFPLGRTSVFDEPLPSAPNIATMEDNVTKFYDLVLIDYLLKVCEISEALCFSNTQVGHILREILVMRELLANPR